MLSIVKRLSASFITMTPPLLSLSSSTTKPTTSLTLLFVVLSLFGSVAAFQPTTRSSIRSYGTGGSLPTTGTRSATPDDYNKNHHPTTHPWRQAKAFVLTGAVVALTWAPWSATVASSWAAENTNHEAPPLVAPSQQQAASDEAPTNPASSVSPTEENIVVSKIVKKEEPIAVEAVRNNDKSASFVVSVAADPGAPTVEVVGDALKPVDTVVHTATTAENTLGESVVPVAAATKPEESIRVADIATKPEESTAPEKPVGAESVNVAAAATALSKPMVLDAAERSVPTTASADDGEPSEAVRELEKLLAESTFAPARPFPIR